MKKAIIACMPVIRESMRTFRIPTVEAGMPKEQKFRSAVIGGIREALSGISSDFEHPLSPADRLAYHNQVHTRGAIWRTGIILRAMKEDHPEMVSDRDILLGEFTAAWHDRIQAWTSGDGIKRNRSFGRNEIDSMKAAFDYMRQANSSMGEQVFTADDMRTVRDAILLTVPNFDKKLETVTQPEFGKYRHNLIAQAVALADLGGAGMEGFQTARWTADALFLEENMDIAAYLGEYPGQAQGRRHTNTDLEKQYAARLDGWLTYQQSFTTARGKQLEREIEGGMDERVQGSVWSVFGKDGEVLPRLAILGENRRNMSFSNLVKDIKTSLNDTPKYDFSDLPELAGL